ncbi:hypothetical protein EV360DRAFT_90713 [Lentinula raphanica]|nr:hypothetical protein EV360DRAFT_90713 [Lentinula raphanica]
MAAHFLEEDAYAGVLSSINEDAANRAGELLDDLEEVTEDHVGMDTNSEDKTSSDNQEDINMVDMTELSDSIKEVSKGVSEKTAHEYARLMQQCKTFVHERRLIPNGALFFTDEPHPWSAQCLAALIMDV